MRGWAFNRGVYRMRECGDRGTLNCIRDLVPIEHGKIMDAGISGYEAD